MHSIPSKIRGRWLRFNFGSRTMFVVVTAICLWLGYQANWMRQRHEYLSTDGVVDTTDLLAKTPRKRPPAPAFLWMLGEHGVADLAVCEYSSADYGLAARLFPEAEVSRPAMFFTVPIYR